MECPRLVLASSSPRRKAILNLLGVLYEVVALPVAEHALPGETPEAAARRVALLKAQVVAAGLHECVVVGADTIVLRQGRILGKPANARDATAMLRGLRNRRHRVITGLAVLDLIQRRTMVTSTATEVLMRAYSDAEISAYVARGEPFDKAGAYAVQDRLFRPAAVVEGCYLNVVGLPACTLVITLAELGYRVPVRVEQVGGDKCSLCGRARASGKSAGDAAISGC